MNQEQVQQIQQEGQSRGLTPTEIAQVVAQTVSQTMQAGQPQQQQQYTDEQLDQMFATYRPGMDLIEQLFGEGATPEGRLAAFNQMVSSIVKNAGHHAAYIADGRAAQLYQQIQEPLQAAQYLDMQRFFTDLYDGHPGLQEFDPLVRGMMPVIQQQQGWPQDRQQRIPFVREYLTNTIKQNRPDFDPKKGAQGAQPSQQSFQQQNPFVPQQQPGQYQSAPSQQPRQSLPSFSGQGGQAPAARMPSGAPEAAMIGSVKEATGGHGF